MFCFLIQSNPFASTGADNTSTGASDPFASTAGATRDDDDLYSKIE